MPKIVLFVILIFLAGVILPFIYGAHWAFYLYEMVYFLNPENRWWASYIPLLPYSKISVIVLMSVFIIKYKDYQKNKLVEIPQFKWIILIFLSFFIAYFYAIVPEMHWYFLVLYLKLIFVLGFSYKILDSQKKIEWALFAYILGCFYIGFEAFSTGRNIGNRVEGIGLPDSPDSNGAAAAITPALPLLIFYFWQGSKKVKVYIAIAGAFIVNALILINSRGAFVGVAAGAMYFFWEMLTSNIKVKYQKTLVFIFMTLGFAVLAMLVDESFMERLNTLGNLSDEDASGSHRYRMWLATFDLMNDYPFGVGAYGYEFLSPNYVEAHLFAPGQKHKAVHSIWFQALSEVGWHGAFFLIMLVLSTFKIAKLTKRKCIENNDIYQYYLAHALLSSFVATLVVASFINQFRVTSVYLIILFITCLYSVIVLHEKSK